MRKCEVAVLGLGLMGGAALGALLDAGVDALGFDPVAAGSDRGSSHGSCRIFRRFNFENPNYTGLSDEAHAGWIRLQAESGQTVLTDTPILEAGRPGSAMVASSRAAAIAKGRPDPKMTASVANKEFPAFNLPDDWDVVVQDGGAILHTATVMKLMRSRAGNRVIGERASFTPQHDGVSIRTDSEEFFAERVILALGPWMGRALPQLAALLNVTRQAVGWFKPVRPDTVVSGRFPIFILDRGPDDMVYGFPDFEQRGVKAAPHNHGPVVGPDDWGPQASDAELHPIGEALAALVPDAAGPIIDRDVCLYTNTAPADIRLDAGEEFIIDRWPESRLIICSACSGHGAKFAPAIGQRLARLATDPSYRAEPFFQLSRYSQFA
ncbi:FAD-dependent oxidoreductase [Bradyrhizobium sp. BR 10261]|uniref:FAD-dependent oxidoreductase n=1 Tax=Bradyrhizobium sp. BR 10261 TaxID=2749992 RepID=UPI001C654660|nr:FAD-dependent oxidoreductase [Bradyrhizobium sp. BR 10261]MBW7965542.1 FAD-dependent oxidoreductase [Bradyrhizobium sp. BR 10261]